MMLTLKRLKALTEAYGADQRRWPQDECLDLGTLASPAARRLLREAQNIDAAIADVSARDDARLEPGEEVAALARLRSAVAARIAAPMPGQRRNWWSASRAGTMRMPAMASGAADSRLAWAGLTLGSVCALGAGLWIGCMPAPGGTVDLMTILQPHLMPGLGW